MFSFAMTPLGNLFFGLTLIVFLSLVMVKNTRRDIFLHTLLLVSLGVIFYAHDLVTLFIGWEVMTWSSYFIIAKTARLQTLQKYILFNLGAGFALLGAMVLIYSFSGSFVYSEIDFSQVPTAFRIPIYLLLFITIVIKSGVIPFHYWVVDSYEESNDIFSAILSAILSKAGIFLFILMMTQIIGYHFVEAWFLEGIAWLGVITSIVATFKAIAQEEIKRLLAYSSIAQIGYIITILAVANGSGIEAGLYHTVIHTFVKLLLFINAAAIIAVTGQSRFSQLGALLYRYPVLFILLLIGIIALAGMPPLGGFSSKFLIYTTLLTEKKALLLTAVMFSSASAFLYCYKLIYGIYLGQPTHTPETYQKVPVSFYIPQFIGAMVVILLGFMPSLGTAVFNPILTALGFDPIAYSSLYELSTPFASFNGGVVMGIFVLLFVIILALTLSLKQNQAVTVRNRLDISYCGEEPRATDNLHYGYGMGQELIRIGFIRRILENSVKPFWEQISTTVRESSSLIQKLYNLGVQSIGVLILLFFTSLLFYYVVFLGVQ